MFTILTNVVLLAAAAAPLASAAEFKVTDYSCFHEANSTESHISFNIFNTATGRETSCTSTVTAPAPDGLSDFPSTTCEASVVSFRQFKASPFSPWSLIVLDNETPVAYDGQYDFPKKDVVTVNGTEEIAPKGGAFEFEATVIECSNGAEL